MLTPRMKMLLEVLLTNETVMSVKELAEQVGVSKRTIQRELEYIGSSLKPYDVTFQSKTGVGVWIEGTKEKKDALLGEIASNEVYDAANREERRKRLTLEILKEKGLKKLFIYSSKFQVSEATIRADLEIVEKWLLQYNMKIVRKPGSGIYVEGTEQNYRKAIRAFIHDNMDTTIMWEAYETPLEMSVSYDAIKKSGIGIMLQEETIQRVVNCIAKLSNPNIHSMTESSHMGLVIHIAIAIHRVLQNEIMEEDHTWNKQFQEDEEYQLAEDIVWSLEEEFHIEIPDIEISYICLHIKGAKHEVIHWEGKQHGALDSQETKQLLNDMIYAFDKEKAYLLRRDEEFIQGLLAHLQPTLIRLQHGMEIHNPILEGIMRDYADIFAKCEIVARVIEERLRKPVPKAEVGFLAVHFGAALVRAEGLLENLRPVKVAVICSSGIGISRLMSSKLEKIFQERMILKTYGKRDMTAYEEQKYDFCITSIQMETSSIPLIEVNPLLNEEDIDRIRKMVTKYERMPRKKKETTGFEDQMEEVHLVATQINHIIKNMQLHKVNPKITLEELLMHIGTQLSPYEDQQNMIRKSINEREKIATQIYAELEFGLFHARTAGVSYPNFHIWMSEDLGAFQDAYFKQIKVAFVMLLPIDENLPLNSQVLGYISGILVEDSSFMDVVLRGEKGQVRELLAVQLKKYFASYLGQFTETT
ncbi:MAG: transcription antiterminator [Eubacteriales bacterium]